MQSVFIINFNSLYEILDEIKENLSFKIIKFENEENFKKNLDLDTIDYLVILKTNHKLLLNNDITDKNLLDFSDLPLSLKKLLELINIKLIKLKFNQQSKIIIKDLRSVFEIIKQLIVSKSDLFRKFASFSNFIILKDKFSFISSRISYSELKFIIKTFCIIVFNNSHDNSCTK